MLCTHLPDAFDRLGITAVLADQMEAAGGLVAAATRRPWASVACALPINPEPAVPPPYLGWRYDASSWGLHRNRGGERISQWLMTPHNAVLARHAQRLGVPARRGLAAWLSPHVQVSQGSAAFDYPREELPRQFHYVGLLAGPSAVPQTPAAMPVRDGRPLVFAAFGTLQGARTGLFRRVALACRRLDLQLWVAHCGGLDAAGEAAVRAAGADWVTDFLPQRAVLAQADVLVTHAGFNSVLESLCAGVPMLALPMAFDQPGVAARVAYHGAGLRLDHRWATVGSLQSALSHLLDEPAFARRAQALGATIRTAGGAPAAADAIETALALPRSLPAAQPAAHADLPPTTAVAA